VSEKCVRDRNRAGQVQEQIRGQVHLIRLGDAKRCQGQFLTDIGAIKLSPTAFFFSMSPSTVVHFVVESARRG